MSDVVKALSVKQPWAYLLCKGYKDIENRTWSTNYRGWFFVHAGQEPDVKAYDRAAEILRKYHGEELPDLEDMKTGGIVGKARLVDCVETHVSPWWNDETDYGFVIDMAHPVPFRECKGQLRFFEPDLDLSEHEPNFRATEQSNSNAPRRPY